MGLDGVELIMAVEEEFKIAISDADAVQCDTVGKLVDHVCSRLRQSHQEPCASQHGFYIVRREMMRVLGLARSQITPESKLDGLVPAGNRRQQWGNLIAAITGGTHEPPGLVRPQWMDRVIGALTVAVFILLVVLAWRFGLAASVSVIGAIFVALIFIGIVNRLTFPWRSEFPSRFTNVRDLVQFITTLESGVWSKEEVFLKIRAITVEQLGVKESQVTMDANFIDDLGVG